MENTVSPEICAVKHKQIDDELKCHAEQLEALVKSDATNTANLKLLMKACWGLFGTVLAALSGFLIWYIQSL